MTDMKEAMASAAAAVNAEMDRLLPMVDGPESRLFEAMRYSTLAGGKRLRPFLVTSTARIFGVSPSSAIRVAASVEMLHTYSLIHDDLPAMDNDDLRRGMPTCHRKFDEATAILAGDALLTRAFEILAEPETHADPAVRCELVLLLGRASGAHGMVGGQMFDLAAKDEEMDMHAVTRLQQMKTGRLIGYSCEAGAVLGKAPRQARAHVQAYAHDLGLAFQIVDDLLDVEGDAAEMGKAAGKDADAGKATFVSLLGVERARAQASMLVDQAVSRLESFDEKADLLRDVAKFVLERRN